MCFHLPKLKTTSPKDRLPLASFRATKITDLRRTLQHYDDPCMFSPSVLQYQVITTNRCIHRHSSTLIKILLQIFAAFQSYVAQISVRTLMPCHSCVVSKPGGLYLKDDPGHSRRAGVGKKGPTSVFGSVDQKTMCCDEPMG